MHVIGSREEGGAERLFLRLTAALAHHGEEVLCVLRPSSKLVARVAPDLRREMVRMRSVFDPFARARLGAVARGFGAQVVQTYMGRATRIARFSDAPTGAVHVARVGSYADVKTVRHAHGWIASNQGIIEHLVTSDLPRDRVFNVPHLVETAATPVSAAEREAARRSLGLDPDAAVVLCLGRLHRERGIDLVVDAVSRLPGQVAGRTLNLLVVGDGPQRRALAEQAAAAGLGQRVCWVHAEPTPQPYLGLADLFVYPSRESAVGTGILEAWNHGVPVVATRTRAGCELLEGGGLGTLVATEDAASLAEAIAEALTLPGPDRETQVARAREVIARRHTAPAVVSACLEAYAAVAA